MNVPSHIRNFLKAFARFSLPHTCVLCHDKAQNNDLCAACAAELPWLGNSCKQCALPLNDGVQIQCGACQSEPPYYDHTIALFHYAEPISNMVSSFKFHQKLLYGNLFGNMLLEKLQRHFQSEAVPELLLPVPLHASRLRERGYNQALELARPLSNALHIPIDYQTLVRTRATEQQSLIDEDKRKANIRGAFTIARPLSIKHVALIDDVITTGSTINECSKVLKKNGVEKVTVFALARTSLN